MPIYDEYLDEYLDVVPKKPAINFVNLRPVSEENLTIIRSQKNEKIKHSECVERGSLPLCYSSFELIRQRLKASKQKQKFEDMENLMNFLEVEDDEDEQSCSQSQLMEKLVVCNGALDQKERGGGFQINASFNLSHSSISSQEEGVYVLDYVEEQNDTLFEVLEKNEVVNSKILNEVADISFETVMRVPFKVLLKISLTVCKRSYFLDNLVMTKWLLSILKFVMLFMI